MDKAMEEYTTYQSGEKEGEPLEPEAIKICRDILGYDTGDERWGNCHDTVREGLSDSIKEIKNLKDGSIVKMSYVGIFVDSRCKFGVKGLGTI